MLARFFGPSSYKKGTGKKNLSDKKTKCTSKDLVDEDDDNIEIADREAKDSIPFRILLSVLDEIFQLQKNKWLRRRTMAVLSQIIRTMLGDSISRKIVASIESATSLEQVC